MVIFCSLIVPMPHAMRRRLFTFLSESPIIAKLQYGMKITFIFILILFIDSVNRVYRVQLEVSAANKAQGGRFVQLLLPNGLRMTLLTRIQR
jgi:B-cell receptor-associated protein 31